MRYQIKTPPEKSFVLFIDFNSAIADAYTFFESPSYERERQPRYVRDLFEIEGVASVCIDRYQIRVERGALFEWHNLIPHIRACIALHFPDALIFQKLKQGPGKSNLFIVSEDGKLKAAPKKERPNKYKEVTNKKSSASR